MDDVASEFLDYMGIKTEKGKVFTQPVVYTFYDCNETPIYVGKSICFTERFRWHQRKDYYKDIRKIGLVFCNDEDDMDLIELIEIKKKRTELNKQCNKKHEEHYLFIAETEMQIEIKSKYDEHIFPIEEYFENGNMNQPEGEENE